MGAAGKTDPRHGATVRSERLELQWLAMLSPAEEVDVVAVSEGRDVERRRETAA